jgi:Carboxypeptidase regulatory-like domain/TonB dependent receptor
LFVPGRALAQSGNAGSIEGVVKDSSGGVVAGASVEISYEVSGFHRQTTTGADGSFRFTNVPFNSYHMVITAPGFANYTQDVDLRSSVPTSVQVGLKVGSAAGTTITVEASGSDLVENESTFHTDIHRGLFEKLPLESASSSLTSLVTLASPGAVAALTDPSQCAAADFQQNVAANPNASAPFIPVLGCIDLTRATPAAGDGCGTPQSALFGFHGTGDIREIALYVQDTITKNNWSFNLGVRGDLYRGLSRESQIEPRLGVAYNIKKTNTVMRVSYARILETPFNENLIVATATGNPLLEAIFGGSSGQIRAGQRNEFHSGLQQAFGKYFVVDADYLWKYTHNAYDFSDLLNTPIFFPIGWHNSKISGANVRISVPNFHGLTILTVLGHANARYFQPQVGGLGTSDGPVFRIDHDQAFQQTTHVQYQPWKRAPWIAFNWGYDSGLVAGAVPFATDTTTPVDLTGLTADQQIQAGLFCGSVFLTLSAPLVTCAPSQYGSTRLRIPAPGTENDDHNPPRVNPRHLFDTSVGDDDLFHGDRYKWSLRFTVINLTNKTALYNFLSTFSRTHFLTPRTYTAEVGFHF